MLTKRYIGCTCPSSFAGNAKYCRVKPKQTGLRNSKADRRTVRDLNAMVSTIAVKLFLYLNVFT